MNSNPNTETRNGVRSNRIPPAAIESEMALLGALLVDRHLVPLVASIIVPGAFYAPPHERIFSAVLAVYRAGGMLDKIAVAEYLRAKGELERCGGSSYLSALMDSVQTATTAIYHAKVIRETAQLRDLIAAAREVAIRAYAQGESAADLAADFAAKMRDATPSTLGMPEKFGELLAGNKAAPRIGHGLSYGIGRVNRVTNGMVPGGVTILAGRPGAGKSAAAEIIAIANASTDPVLYFALEMGAQYTADRIGARLAGVGVAAYQRSGRAAQLCIEDPTSWFDLRIVGNEQRLDVRAIDEMVGSCAPALTIVDQARHLAGWFERGARRSDLAPTEILHDLAAVAKRRKTHMLVLQQLNRDADGHRPSLGDLRDCGAFEEIADCVLLLHRPFDGQPESDTIAEWIVAKNRRGPSCITHASWDGVTMDFGEISDEQNRDAPCCAERRTRFGKGRSA